MTYTIRLATLDDLASVEAIVQRAYEHYVDAHRPQPKPMLADHRSLISDGLVHVAELQGTVSGVLVLVSEPNALLLENIAVTPDAQG